MDLTQLKNEAARVATAVVKAVNMRNNLSAKKDLSEKEKVLMKNLETAVRSLVARHEKLLDAIWALERSAKLAEMAGPANLTHRPFASLR